MRLLDLEPQFIRYEERIETWVRHKADGYMDDPTHEHGDQCWESVTGPRVYLPYAETLAEAQGVEFLCPKCFAANGGNVGTHGILVWFRDRGVPDSAEPGAAYVPGETPRHPEGRLAQRWTVTGTGLADLTTVPSIALEGPCAWHGIVTNGDAA